MIPQLLHGLAVVLVLGEYAVALPHTYQPLHNHTQLIRLLRSRDDSASDWPEPASITRMAAIGDSYSAGIGAGNRLDEGDGMSHHSVPEFSNFD
jgi:hypothetical protein